MKTVAELFKTESLNILGYTLLHSLWQALAIAVITFVVLRFVSTKSSNIRYAIASASMFAAILLSVVTFIYLESGSKNFSAETTVAQHSEYISAMNNAAPARMGDYLLKAQSFIHYWMPFFLAIWIAGTLLFCVRIFMGLAFVEKLRRESLLLQNEWSDFIKQRVRELQIERVVSLAESSLIKAPVVIGYLKPLILIPIGMCSSLSTAQLETIFLHELVHIRRKDYLINLVQAFVEAIYFFNPFVWIISEIVKREREHCCDDAVVQLHGNATEYARALTMLEEVRLTKAGLSLSLAKNKNQLLERIKRLMEKSVKSNHSRERIIPALLLVIGLACASWVTTQTGTKEINSRITHSHTVASDTTKKDKRANTNKDRNANSQQKSSKNKSNDSDTNSDEKDSDDDLGLSPIPKPIPDFDFELPPTPDLAGMIPPFPEIELIFKDFNGPHLDWEEGDWEDFSEEFEKNFKSKFGDLYEENQGDIQYELRDARNPEDHCSIVWKKMLDDIQMKLNSRFDSDWELQMNDMAAKQEEWARNWARQAEKMALLQDEHLKDLSENMSRQAETFQRQFEAKHKEFEKMHKAFEEKTRAFEDELRKELMKDGYLGKDEKLESIHWRNGKLEVNGERVKVEDEKKYNDIREKYFSEPRGFE